MRKSFFLALLVILASFCCVFSSEQIGWAGVRSSTYGANPRPSDEEWRNILLNMDACFSNSIPAAIWIVGIMSTTYQGKCRLEFPSNGQNYENVEFYETNNVDHEQALSLFDDYGIRVYLQVEPGLADVMDLIDIVLEEFGHHPCVVGFGVDVEWYPASSTSKPNDTIPVSDSLSELWENQVKSHNSDYTIFLKHYNYKTMPKTYRGDIIFADDSQYFPTLDSMAGEFSTWAGVFAPNPVMYQVGYSSDYRWWRYLDNPPRDIADAIVNKINNPEQKVGIIWVDFSLEESELAFLWDENTFIKNHGAGSSGLNTINPLKILFNPYTSLLSIQYANNENIASSLWIYSSDGRIVKSHTINNRAGTIIWNRANNASGEYYISLQNRKGCFTQKVMVVK